MATAPLNELRPAGGEFSMTLPTLLATPDPDPDPYLPVLHDLSAAGYVEFHRALGQARDMVAAFQQIAADSRRSPAERTWAALTAANQQAAIQPFAALIGDRTELDALWALDEPTP
jgi:hypothetical protein